MTELIDSIAIETVSKRKPKKKQHRLLCELRDRLISEIRQGVKERKFHVPNVEKVQKIRAFNKRINRRLEKEDRAMMEQTQLRLINSFDLYIIRPGKKRAIRVLVDAADLRSAKKAIKKQYGSKTKFV